MTPLRIAEEGVYDLTEFQYHSDPVIEPSLSSGIAKVLYEKTPRHAWNKHPRLNPDLKIERKKLFDDGSAAHAILLGQQDKLAIIPHADFRKDVAKAARDDAYNNDLIPILEHELPAALRMAADARAQIDMIPEIKGAFTNGKPEQTLIAKFANIFVRVKVDWMPDDPTDPKALWPDYKSTGVAAGPDQWGRRSLFDLGYDIQKILYSRVITKLFGVEKPRFQFIVQENEEPFCLALHDMMPSAVDQAEQKVDIALHLWRQCIMSNRWPGWTGAAHYNEAPGWHEAKLIERQNMLQVMENEGQDLFGLGIDWKAAP